MIYSTMPILPSFSPPSSFRLGLRAITGNSGNFLIFSAVRSFSTRHYPIASCSHYSSRGPLGHLKTKANCHPFDLSPLVSVRTLSIRFRAITDYTKIPDSYEDSEGLPFRKEELTQRDVNRIFGAHLPARQANKLLRILHGRRVAGTLDDPDLRVNTSQFSDKDQEIALKYLRDNIPVDEVINAGLRAEDELKYLEAQEQGHKGAEEQFEETEPQGPPSDAVEEVKVPTGRLPREPKSDSPYGKSPLDQIRADNIAKREAEEKRLEEERIKREEEEALSNTGTLQTEQQQPKELSPFMKKWIERTTSDFKEPPKMKAWERLLPSLAMTILILAGCAGFAAIYKPPRPSWRVWPDIPPAAATLLGLIGINLTVFCLWKAPMLTKFLNKYFLLVAATPRPIQLVGAIFSHQNIGHLACNMIPLWFFGTRLHDEIGRGNFLAIYVSSGAVGFMYSLANLVLLRGLGFTSLGASGAVFGIAAAFFWLHKFDEFKVFGYPPDPMSGPQGLAFIGLILGIHIPPLFAKKVHTLDTVSHIGGILGGILSAELVKRHMDKKERIRAERLKTMGALQKVVQIKGDDPRKTPRLVAGP